MMTRLGCPLVSFDQLHLLLLALLSQNGDRVLGERNPHSSRVAILRQTHHSVLGRFKLREFVKYFHFGSYIPQDSRTCEGPLARCLVLPWDQPSSCSSLPLQGTPQPTVTVRLITDRLINRGCFSGANICSRIDEIPGGLHPGMPFSHRLEICLPGSR